MGELWGDIGSRNSSHFGIKARFLIGRGGGVAGGAV